PLADAGLTTQPIHRVLIARLSAAIPCRVSLRIERVQYGSMHRRLPVRRRSPRSEVNLGSLDTTDQFVPTHELWTVRREAWLPPFPLKFSSTRTAQAPRHVAASMNRKVTASKRDQQRSARNEKLSPFHHRMHP